MAFDYENNEGFVMSGAGGAFTNATVEERGKEVLLIRLTADYVGSLDVEVTREAAEQLCVALWSNQSLGPWTLGELRKSV